MKQRILLIDDEEEIAELLEDFLLVEGYEVYQATTGDDAKKILAQTTIHFILLDIMMPGESGFTLCKQIRERYNTPILFLSALQNDTDKIRGLSIGADDYIVKNATPLEIIARIKAVNRRVYRDQPASLRSEVVRCRDVELQLSTRRLQVNDQEVVLTAKEFELMNLFLSHLNQVFTHEQIIQRIWGYEDGDSHTVRVYIAKLREKIETKTSSFQISTVWGVGYKAEERIG
ncbi:response regulator transcription factor [Priestia koreensis]|uniref:response regulator transcription factor n=1 Tax=Priestia koreensis TaxID=284581 RepID=UPI001F57071D|nr:response regulator transcription factor [Priestia koreensis]UNL86171.1 response regulator transcription factor [Priestia koreensis]